MDIAFVSHEYLLPDRILELFFELSKGTVKVVETSVKANGPAIKGGCVTWRSIRAGSWYFRQKTVPVQDRYGVLFAIQVQIILGAGAIAVQF